MSDLWTIIELPNGEGGEHGETFVWTSNPDKPPTPSGGARAAPRGGTWTFGGSHRQKRTDYPSSLTPSVQVLGPVHKPQTLDGMFDDRYNFPGYAVAEHRRLEAMLERGNLCRLSFQDQAFLGLFTDWSFPYRRDWQIGYSITFDVHARPEDFDLSDRSPFVDISPAVAQDQLDNAITAILQFHKSAPRSHLVGDTIPNTESRLAQAVSDVDQLGRTLDNQEITPSVASPVDAYTRMATQFHSVQGSTYELLISSAAYRSDTGLVVQTAMGVLGFEDWTRSVRYAARLAMGRARRGEQACAARAEPDAKRLYRPQQGESLYAISRKFYGTPYAWGLIYKRNHLTSVTLTGREVLVIPDRGAA
jgi:hypothetical protein